MYLSMKLGCGSRGEGAVRGRGGDETRCRRRKSQLVSNGKGPEKAIDSKVKVECQNVEKYLDDLVVWQAIIKTQN